MRSMLEPPSRADHIRLPPGAPPRWLLTVDTEEEFDWNGPFTRDGHGLTHAPALHRFQNFCESLGVQPVYLVDWPIVQCAAASEILADAAARGAAEIGMQLHPWVNPPFEEKLCVRNSFAGNLPPDLERAKLLRLRDAIVARYGLAPLIYRAGRYGLGPNTAPILAEAGVRIDSSVRPLFDYSGCGGPDYSRHPPRPYWIAPRRGLAELPLTSVYSGTLRQAGRALFPLLRRARCAGALAARTRMMERIPLTPEGVCVEEARRGVDVALADGLPILVFAFHSPSLAPGHTAYVRDAGDLERFYDWWRAIADHLGRRGAAPTTVRDLLPDLNGPM